MGIATRIGGVWTGVDIPWVKVGNVWKPVLAGYVKDGAWKQAFSGDKTPPVSPVISLQNVDNKYIRVGVRMPQSTNQLDIKRIRVLVASGETYPANPNSGGFLAAPNVKGGNEAWSDFFFNNWGEGLDGKPFHTGRETNVSVYKFFAPTWKVGNTLPANRRYSFRAWAQDIAGNWSPIGAAAYIVTAKNAASASDTYTRTAVLYPVFVGTRSGTSLVAGEPYVGSSPIRKAYFDYGDQVKNLVGDGSTIVSAQVRISRKGVDHGQPSAKQFAVWHGADPADSLEPGLMFNSGSTTLSGISKGAVVTKDLRAPWLAGNNFGRYFKGFEFYESSSDIIGSQAVYNSVEADPNQGALTVRWRD